MNPQPTNLSRRRLLQAAAVGAGSLAGAPLLTACGDSGSENNQPNPEGEIRRQKDVLSSVPKYVPIEYAKPDLASSKDVAPGFLGYPTELVRTVAGKPGSGGSYKAMTPAWWAIPPGLGDNEYYAAVNEDLGATIDFTVINGADYGTKISAILASKRVPDVTQVPVWNRPQDFSAAAVPALFADLTEHLGKDISKKWPNLANLPTKAWQACTFGGRLYGLPSPGGGISDGLFYRADLFEQLGVEPPRNAEDWLSLCEELTDAGSKRWACGNVSGEVRRMYGTPPTWSRQNGKLVNSAETEQFVEALEFNRKLFAAGYVHPSTVANTGADAKALFEGGQMLMYMDGVGAWHEALTRQRPSNPDFNMQLFPPFSADGTAGPVYYRGGWSRMQSYIKRETPSEKIEELLGIMNYIAAPFGTREYDMITYGAEGVTYERNADGVPVLNEAGKQQVTFTYGFLIGRPAFISKPEFPDYVRDFHAWQQATAPYLVDDLLDGLNVQEPPRFQTLQQPLIDKESDILRGRAKVGEWKDAVAAWRKRGGDELRAFYDSNLEQVGR